MPENQNSNFGNIVSAAMPALGGIISAIGQGAQNRKARKFAREMYGRQRQDALDDWERTNAYNSPREQMQRLQEAGLNPHLVYGGSGNAGEAGGIRSSDTPNIKGENTMRDMPQAFMGIHDLRMKSAQADNVQEQNKLIQKEIELKDAQRLATLMGTTGTKVKIDQDKLQLELDRQLFDTNIEYRRRQTENMLANTRQIASNVDIAQTMKQPNLQLAIQHLINAKKDAILKDKTAKGIDASTSKTLHDINEIDTKVQNMIKEGKLRDYELKFKEIRGKTADWPAFMRMFKDILDRGSEELTGNKKAEQNMRIQ